MVVLTHHIVDLAAHTAHQVQGVTAKPPSSEAPGSVSTVTSTSAPLLLAARNSAAISLCLPRMRLKPTPMLWNRLSVNSACVCSMTRQETQRP
jgi:hypothetical protein